MFLETYLDILSQNLLSRKHLSDFPFFFGFDDLILSHAAADDHNPSQTFQKVSTVTLEKGDLNLNLEARVALLVHCRVFGDCFPPTRTNCLHPWNFELSLVVYRPGRFLLKDEESDKKRYMRIFGSTPR